MVNTKKLFKTALEGVVSSSLAATMLLTQLNLGVKATNSASTQFIPVAKLNEDTTEYGLCADKTPQKVFFGKNGDKAQAWWIAGYQASGYGADGNGGALVLLCDPDQPMNESQVFLASGKYEEVNEGNSTNYYNTTEYTTNWGCTYQDGYTPAGKVFANHYGGSDIRTVLKDYETDTNKFSTAEQGMMKDTKVRTCDAKNDEFYSTTDKLYLAAEDFDDGSYITVGNNVVNENGSGNAAVNNGLEVGLKNSTGPEGSPYISGSNWFWLRSPNAGRSNYALRATTGICVGSDLVLLSRRCVPACALDLSSVIFASTAAPAAKLQSSSALSDGAYLRVAEPLEGAKIKATATTSGNTITVTKDSEGTGDEYLYIQGNDGGNDWVYYKKIDESTTLAANAIHKGLTNLENCEVWLETTKDNVTYAKEITDVDSVTQVEIVCLKETGRVITGVGGDAGYKYNRKTNTTVFYCNPAEGYKVDKIEKDENGVVTYVSFKIL